MRRLAIVIALGAMWTAPPAQAWTAPNQRPAPPAVNRLVTEAQSFWSARNVTGCPSGITAWTAPDLSTADESAWGRGDGATCELWVSDDLAATLETGKWPSVDTLVDACTAVTHEVGHALGLQHTETGVMAGGASKPPWPHAWAPYSCVVWAQQQLAAWDRHMGISESRIKKWARITRERLLNPPIPQKGVLRG